MSKKGLLPESQCAVLDALKIDFKCDPETGEFFNFNGRFYERLKERDVLRLIDQELRQLDVTRENTGLATINQACKQILEGLGREAIADHSFFEGRDKFLAFENKVLSLESAEFLNFSDSIPVFRSVNYSIELEADCSKWLETLEEIYEGDQETISALQEAMGYIFISDCRMRKSFFLYGDSGANGKTLILNVISSLVGERNTSSIGFNRMNDRFSMVETRGKLVNICNEVSIGKLSDNDKFKAWTSGDLIEGERKYEAPLSFRPTAKQFWACNEIPRMPTDPSTIDRCLFLSHERSFRPDEQDKNLLDKLKAELPGILNWSLKGRQRLLEGGDFETPTRSREVSTSFKNENDTVADFYAVDFENYFEVTGKPGDAALKENVYRSYCEYCDSNKMPFLSAGPFFKKLYREVARDESVTPPVRRQFAELSANSNHRINVGGKRKAAVQGLIPKKAQSLVGLAR